VAPYEEHGCYFRGTADGGLIDGCEDGDSPDIVGIEERSGLHNVCTFNQQNMDTEVPKPRDTDVTNST
jgi:hypothetical protein